MGEAVLGYLILLFVATPLVELWLLLEISHRIGLGPTVAIVLVTGIVGGAVARWQGTEALGEIVQATQQGRDPGIELAAGALFVVGAAFLVTPGVVTDVAGFLLMVPWVRRQAAKALVPRLAASPNVHVQVGGPAAGPGAGPGFGGGSAPEEPKRVDAEARVRTDGGDRDGDGNRDGDDEVRS